MAASPDPAHPFRAFVATLKDALFLASLIVTISGFVGAAGMQFLWPMFIEKLRTDLGVATSADIEQIQSRIDEISGENRLTRMSISSSYVEEPVSRDQKIRLTLVIARTNKGLPCTLIEDTPLFVDERDIPFPGAPIKPIKQLTTESTRLSYELTAPAPLQNGRVGVYLSKHFSCPFGPNGEAVTVFEETDIVWFQLDPAN